MARERRTLSLNGDGDADEETPWPAFGDVALALLLVFVLFILAQFLHYDRIFVLERLQARQDSVASAIRQSLRQDQREHVEIQRVNDYRQRITFQAELLFPSCRAEVRAEGQDLMRRVGAALRDFAEYFDAIQVEGHTDVQSPAGCGFADNWALSSARATAVVRVLADTAAFRHPPLLSAVGRGEYHPVGVVLPSDTTAELLARHRRIELLLQYTDRGILGPESNE